ncbi:MAG: hypothetical protein JO287_08145 [Pseudonocardiales bacterium]|nr:hypothetical protein [Pseudonocardiales bacterium]
MGADLDGADRRPDGRQREDPRPYAAELLGSRACRLPVSAWAGRIGLRADAGYFAAELTRAALLAKVKFRHEGPADRAAVAHPR